MSSVEFILAISSGDIKKVNDLTCFYIPTSDLLSGLAIAISKDDSKLVKLIVEILKGRDYGFDTYFTNHAAYLGHLEILKLLIDLGVPVNLRRILISASSTGKIKINQWVMETYKSKL
jgi:hypothetical protein